MKLVPIWSNFCQQNAPFNNMRRFTYLVSRLVKLLGIEGSTKAEGDTWAEEDVVGNSSDTTVVDLGLGVGDWVKSVLGGNLKTDVVTALGVPDSLGTSLDL